MTPAFSDSPRSTRGTTRMTAYWNWAASSESGRAGTIGLLRPGVARVKARAQVRDVRAPLGIGVAGARVRGQPDVRDLSDECVQQRRRDQWCQAGRCRGHGARERQQDVLAAA